MSKTVLITGATGGLGQAMVESFCDMSSHLILTGRNSQELERITEKYTPYYASIECKTVDFSDSMQTNLFLQEIADKHIDIAILNAGYAIYQTAEHFTVQEVQDMMAVNLVSTILLSNALLKNMYENRTGHIIFIASQAGKITTPKSTIYSATKAGIIGYANGLRLEAKKYGVHITTVNPGPIATNFFKRADSTGTYVKAVGKYMLFPEDVAKKVFNATKKPVREINLPKMMHIGSKLYVLFPRFGDFLTGNLFNKK